jgi:putative hemolysin
MLIFALAVASALIFSCLCSIAEAVLLTVSYAHIESLGKSRAAEILRGFKRQIDLPIAAVLGLNTIAHTLGASVAGAYYGEVFDESTLWIFSGGFVLAVLVFAEIVPKTVGVAYAARLAVPVAYGTKALVVVLRPMLMATQWISRALTRGSEQPVTSMEEIRLLAALGRTEGVVGTVVADMIEGVATLRELKAWDVMIPRARVVYLSGQRSLAENLEVVRKSGHSRFPWSPTGELDRIEGVILVKDLMFLLHEEGETLELQDLATKALVVPSTTTLERLLRMFQQERRHLAIVVDEYGGTEGILTLEDVLEEIVGEIEDESDRVDPFVIRRADGSLLCRGWAEARTVLEELGVEPGGIEAVTVGGMVAELAGRVPRVGDQVEFRGHRLTVTQASARRAERVEIQKLAVPGKEPDGA